MGRSCYNCEKLRGGRGKLLRVFSGRDVALVKLKYYAARTDNEVYLLDVLSGKVIARRNA
jgi:hypothetical protein